MATSTRIDSEKTYRTQRSWCSKTLLTSSWTPSIETSWAVSPLSDTTIESRSRKSRHLFLTLYLTMDDKEKIAMLESEKTRLQTRVNQYDEVLHKAYEGMVLMSKQNDALMDLLKRSDKLLQRNLEFMEDVPRQHRIALLTGILLGISILHSLQGILTN